MPSQFLVRKAQKRDKSCKAELNEPNYLDSVSAHTIKANKYKSGKGASANTHKGTRHVWDGEEMVLALPEGSIICNRSP